MTAPTVLPVPLSLFVRFTVMVFEPEDDKDYIIHSSTGTGKTYLVKDLYKRKKSKFISIVSRKSLAYEQYVNFHNWGIKDMVYYENYLDFDSGGLPADKNVCIQVDSLRLLGGKYLSKIKPVYPCRGSPP